MDLLGAVQASATVLAGKDGGVEEGGGGSSCRGLEQRAEGASGVAGGLGQAVIRKCGAKQHKPKDDLTIISVCIT